MSVAMTSGEKAIINLFLTTFVTVMMSDYALTRCLWCPSWHLVPYVEFMMHMVGGASVLQSSITVAFW